MKSWQNIFPLIEQNYRVGFLPLSDEAWMLTPNPWRRFLMDKPAVVLGNLSTSAQSETTSSPCLSEKFLTELQEPNVKPMIIERKVLRKILV